MKVLWVCNIMLPIIAEKLGVEGSNKEGWLSGLCDVLLERREENGIELHVAYPVANVPEGRKFDYHKIELPRFGENAVLHAYGFCEDVANAEKYDEGLEERLAGIIEKVQPDVIHCFGTEFAHTLAVARCCEQPEKLLVGIQGICHEIAKAYMADLPEDIQNKVTFRDWLKKDSIRQQQQKFVLRGEREQEILRLVGNITGRTDFDREYSRKINPNACYFTMNETLRANFYEGQWKKENCEPHTIFISQGDYPLKGLHYLLMAAGRLQEQYTDLKIKIAGNSLVNYKTLKDKLKISAYGSYLRSLIKEYHLENKVHFLGKLTAEQMKEQYLSSGLFVCCSSNENSPNSLGEAMLLGVPCIAADVGGISTIFTGGKDGILYKGFCLNNGTEENNKCYSKTILKDEGLGFGNTDGEKQEKSTRTSGLQRNVENLQKAIEEMWDNPEATLGYCQNARKHARKTHDKEENYQKMTEIYAKIASGGNR